MDYAPAPLSEVRAAPASAFAVVRGTLIALLATVAKSCMQALGLMDIEKRFSALKPFLPVEVVSHISCLSKRLRAVMCFAHIRLR